MRLNTSIRHTSLHYYFHCPARGSLGGHKWGSLKWTSGLDQLRTVYAQRETRTSHDGRQIWLNWVLHTRGEALVRCFQPSIDAPHNLWVGYVVASRDWRHGYARESAGAMIGHLAKNYVITAYKAVVDENNLRSIRVLKKLAFRPAIFEDLHPYKSLHSVARFRKEIRRFGYFCPT
jgi:RimJ/RimL family protein N-acetyltransferase